MRNGNTFAEEDLRRPIEEDEAPWSEPEIIREPFVDGITLVRTPNGGMRAVGWQNAISPDGSVQERRVVVRFVLPPWALLRAYINFRALWPNLWQVLTERSRH